jgi:hypothetical protein
MKRYQVIWLGGILLLVIAVISILWMVSPAAFPGSGHEQSATAEPAFAIVTIAVTPNDMERLPERFVEPIVADYPPLAFADAASAPIDALFISRAMLVEISTDAERRAELDALLDNGKILLVYGATTADLQRALDEPLSTVETTTTKAVFASLHHIGPVPTTGQLIVSDDRPPISVGSLYGYVERSLQSAERFEPYPAYPE